MLRNILDRIFSDRRSIRRRKLDRRASLRNALQFESLESRALLTTCAGDFLTYTQGGWGAEPNGNNPGTYLHANFANAFPAGLQIGSQVAGAASDGIITAGNQAALFTSAQALTDWLPHGGTSGALGGDTVNPLDIDSGPPSERVDFPDDGILAAQTVALSLAVGFDNYNPAFSPSATKLKDLVVTSGPFAGQTVQFVLDTANAILSGITTTGFTAEQANEAATAINENFDNGSANSGTDNGFLAADCDEDLTSLVTIEGRKFEDVNGNSVDDVDPGIVGWHITVWLDSNGDGDADAGETHDIVTGAGGLWTYSEEVANSVLADDGIVSGDGAAGVAWTASEVNQFGWTQTFGNAGYSGTFTGEDTVVGNDFGNFENIDISGTKYEDHNGDGIQNGTDGLVGGFTFILNDDGDGVVDNGERSVTSTDGTWSFTNVGPGAWTVTEAYAGLNWVPTQGEEGYSGVASSGVDVTTGLVFGNTHISAAQGKTIGFWSNKNGQAILAANDGINGWRKALNDLNLRTATGGHFDLSNTGSRTGADKFDCVYKVFRTWLLGATATNMAYMLSAQLAGTQLNVIAGNFGNATSIYVGLQQSDPAFGLIDWSGNSQGDDLDENLDTVTDLVNAYGFANIQALINAANTELGLHGNTTSGSADDGWRDYQEALKIAFDGMNNNLAIFAQ